jgi:hypothetical protein
MHNLQNGWRQILATAEDKYAKHADRHNALMVAVEDTSNHWRQSVLQQDSSLRVSIERLRGNFEAASHRHLSYLKEIHAFIKDNEVWLMRIETEGMPRRAARGSWDARTAQFASMYARINASQAEFDVFKPDYERIARQLPGLALDAAGQPTALQNAPAVPQPLPL